MLEIINDEKKRILNNAAISIIQAILTSVSLFFLYRFLVNKIGIARLGIWSAVLATTSVANMANFGISGSVVKFVAKYIATGDQKKVVAVIETAAVTIGIFIGFIAIIAFPFIGWIIKLVIPENSLTEALAIMPYSLASLWLVMVSGVFQAAHDGAQRYSIKSGIIICGNLFYLLVCFWLVPGHGLVGLAWSQAAQAFFVLCSSWLFLKFRVAGLSLIPFRWNKGVFREIVKYGINFQLISICQMLFDPATKSLLVKFGGLSITGFYEMANRMVLQVRSLIVSANQVLVPAIAGIYEKEPEKINNIYKTASIILVFISAPLLFSLTALAPIISIAWIGHYEKPFVFFSLLLSIGWFFNMLNVPAYFSNLGTGKLRGNLIGTVLIALLNPVLCFLFGSFYGGYGVAVGWMVSLVAGSLLIVVFYHKDNNISFKSVLTNDSLVIVLSAATASAISLVFYISLSDYLNIRLVLSFTVILYFAVIAWSVWRHPVRKRLSGWGLGIVRGTWLGTTLHKFSQQ